MGIGQALTEDGGLCLWSCDAAAGAAGTAFIEVLARATRANVAAAAGRIGAAASGGNWELTAPSARPPLTAAGIADYPGVLATNTWIGGGLPNAYAWDQANNWSLGSIPTSTDDVVIDSGPNQPILGAFYSNSNVSINSLTLNGGGITFSPFGGAVNVLGSIVNNGSLYSYSPSSSIAANGGITNNGSITSINLSGGPITNSGSIGGGSSDSILFSSGDIINNATGQIANCRLTNSGNIINNGSIIGSLTGFISSSGYLTNNGTISHAYLGISGGISNSGLITDCQPGIAADGSYQVSSGDITNNATERSQTRFF
jgi:hypothetical protein